MSKRNKNNLDSDIESLDGCDFVDEGFLDGDVEITDAIATFTFGASENFSHTKETSDTPLPSTTLNNAVAPKNNSCIPNARGFTPPIDGESFTVKRGYQLRPSTLRKLNELKTKHPDINVYLNTILDSAILHYYNYIFNENGHF